MVGGEPFHFVGLDRPQIDLLLPESHGDARGLAMSGIEHDTGHAEHALIPSSGGFRVRDIDDEVVERIDSDCHVISI
jgi:hypothetical protein